jgi:RNA-directed DNA polymerase
MIKAPVSLQDLRRRIYVKAKAEPAWRFWGLYVHVCKMETLRAAYQTAKENNGAPGIDGITFEAIEVGGPEKFLKQVCDDLVQRTYQPMRNRSKEIAKDEGNQVRVLSIPTIRDRVVQGALKLCWRQRSSNAKSTFRSAAGPTIQPWTKDVARTVNEH